MRGRRLPPLPVSPALAELWEREGILDDVLEGRGLRFDNPRPVPMPVPQPFYIPPPDWDEEERERKEREQQAREREFQAELERRLESEAVEPPAKPTLPAPKPSRWHRSAAA